MNLFRKLTKKEAAAFRKWAQDNYRPFMAIDSLWHPEVLKECARINDRAALNLEWKDKA
jgi:hypothetical protein